METAARTMRALHGAITAGLVRACHDLSEGGLGVAAAEMAFAGEVGLGVDLSAVPYEGPADRRLDSVLLFAESNSRFLVEVEPEKGSAFERALAGLPCAKVGETDASGLLTVTGLAGETLIASPLPDLKAAWQTPLVGK